MSSLLSYPVPAPSSPATRKQRLLIEERANQVTHGVATVLAVCGVVPLVRQAADSADTWLSTGCLIYSAALVLVFLASTLSHSFRRGFWKHLFRSLDQVAIFLLIAGSYTPFGLTIARDGGYWLVLLAVWGLALGGIAVKLFITRLRNVPLVFYVLTAWVPVLAARPLLSSLPVGSVGWILSGAACYMTGTLFLANDSRARWFHPAWHVLVMLGAASHFMAIRDGLITALH